MIKQKINTSHLPLLTWLGKVFRKGISADWLEALTTHDVTMYDNGVIATKEVNGVIYINSGTRSNDKFSYAMTKDIITLIKGYDKCIIQCSYPDRFEHLAKKLFLSYNSADQFYYKGDV